MTIAVLVFFGGVLTILSPCILPVLPFVFARSEQRFLTNGLPMLVGMAAAFAGIGTLAAVGGAWAVQVNQYGRYIALALLAAFALTLLSPRLADWLARPMVALGNRLSGPAASTQGNGGIVKSLLLGVATGLLWAPCAGPILGLILAGAALSGPNVRTTLLLFAYAAGAAASLAVALLAGGRIFALLKKSLGAGEWLRRALGVAVLLAVAAIVMGWDSTVLTRLSRSGTNDLESALVERLHPADSAALNPAAMTNSVAMTNAADHPHPEAGAEEYPVQGEMPAFEGATLWLNSTSLTPQTLRGKVVLVDFWTYSCINCLRALPYVERWYEKYKDHGLVVIGVHTPEFAFEKDPGNVRRAVADLHVMYPVALDNDYAIWQAFENRYWPASYFVDAEGRIRAHHFGEGNYDESERILRKLLTDAGNLNLPDAGIKPAMAGGVQAPADEAHDQSPETYVGFERARNFSSPGGFVEDVPHAYRAPPALQLNTWALAGSWTVGAEKAVLGAAHGQIQFRFYARDLHLVLGPGEGGKPVLFKVKIDGNAPGASHGSDTDSAGAGRVDGQRLYQLIRQSGDVREHVFSIEFLDSGVQAYAFTFG
jgi:cytochrome c biogenesis protein CcdA/thiol-disulfide isomerase/thioredoxin